MTRLSSSYIGETLWPGQLGHILIILAFVSILFSVFSYFRGSKDSADPNWNRLGRIGFYLHSLSVIALIGLLFYMMASGMYEYRYVWEHVSDDLPMQYILSAFWEGQEGSFLLWLFWHIVFGLFLIAKTGKLEAPVMFFLGLVQMIIASMLLGIYFPLGDIVYKMGSNPTLLLRETMDAPIFQQADYLSMIEGRGLNPLLQNYWNIIHPPTLFFGFASVTVPFAFAGAGLLTRDYRSWLAPALKYGLFSAGILGTGILMGGAWAYEALSFGGYWAWDPVENMSLVPWLILIAGIHTNMIAKNTGRAIRSTQLYYMLSLVLVLYSTYLTRSGILGDSSAHAFTEMGLEPQLIFFVLFFFILSMAMILWRFKSVPSPEKEESILSREFWMFIGALVLLFSGLIITSSTSLPVINNLARIFNENYLGKTIQDPIPHYNKFQIWIALLICVMTAKTLHLRYKDGAWSQNKMLKYTLLNLGIFAGAGILTFLTSLWIDFFHWKYTVLTLAGWFAVIGNAWYLIETAKLNPKMAGSVMSHGGFGIMIIGIIASGLNERTITTNPFAMRDIVGDEDLASVVKLIRDEPFYVNNYWLTYESDSLTDRERYFKIKFVETNDADEVVDSFYVHPHVLYSNDLKKVAASNPGTKHFISRDVFTHIASLPRAQMDVDMAIAEEDSLEYVVYDVQLNDTIYFNHGFGTVDDLTFSPQNTDYVADDNDFGLGVRMSIYDSTGIIVQKIEPALSVKDNLLFHYPDICNAMGIKARLHESVVDNLVNNDSQLEYTDIRLKNGETVIFQDLEITLTGFDNTPNRAGYTPVEGDIAVAAKLLVYDPSGGDTLKAFPVYIIRDNKPFSVKEYLTQPGLHIRFTEIDPINETFLFQMARDNRTGSNLKVFIAENVPRSDIIVLEAKVFPGINLFWLGSVLMMIGFFVALWNRSKT